MTLCFSQQQAAAVYAATHGAIKGQVFVSPFIGRLDDRGENGMDLIENIIRMYAKGDGHVEVLTASVRSLDHLIYAIHLGTDIATAPLKVFQEWGEKGLLSPGENFIYTVGKLRQIPYEELDLNKDWSAFDVSHELTAAGIDRFAADWNSLLRI